MATDGFQKFFEVQGIFLGAVKFGRLLLPTAVGRPKAGAAESKQSGTLKWIWDFFGTRDDAMS